MKKILTLGIIVSFVILLYSCKNNASITNNENDFDINTASNVVDNYMNLLIKEDYDAARSFYSAKLSKNEKALPITELKFIGYTVEEESQVGKNGFFKLRVSRTNFTEPNASLEIYSMKLIKDAGEYKIDEVKAEQEKEVFLLDGGIRIRNKDSIKTNLVFDKFNLPQYVYAKTDGAKVFKILLDITNFGMLLPSYKGDSVAIATYGKDSFIGVVKIDESMMTQGTATDGQSSSQGGGSQGSGSSGSSGDSGSSLPAKESPIGKEVVVIDYLRDTKVTRMIFSQDEKFLLLQYKDNIGSKIGLYRADNGELASFDFNASYPLDMVDIYFSSFGKDVLNYDIIPKSNANADGQKLRGKWQLSLKDFKAKKL
ncbi:MAG TPA: hypothetical protein VIK72_01735 [Clostridiaceae bacterium]